MGDHDDGFLLRQFLNSLHQLLLVLRVHIGCGFVQNNNRGVLHHSAGDGEPLAFAPGKGAACFADHRIIPLRQFHNEVMAAGFFRRCDDLLYRRIRLAEADVVGDRVVE